MKHLSLPPSGVLFDLDGTLLDSAPAAYAALEALCAETDATLPAFAQVRAIVSQGATAVLRTAHPDADRAQLDACMPRFVAHYTRVMGSLSQPFDGVQALLSALDAASIPWGVVTNKAECMAFPLLREIGWWHRAAAVVAGGTVPERKPDPAPVLHACRQASMDPRQGLFVGDDPRDIRAGHGAGMATAAVTWGYLAGENPANWGADWLLDHVDQLAGLLELEVPA
ncbi:MAG TPA: phosphoglycolate phosphatase [Oleiagrimonas sp.]|nr:phosphoglycolate phosphatase [Oleiagrimonas sp.]